MYLRAMGGWWFGVGALGIFAAAQLSEIGTLICSAIVCFD